MLDSGMPIELFTLATLLKKVKFMGGLVARSVNRTYDVIPNAQHAHGQRLGHNAQVFYQDIIFSV